jgi:hypothetical protein
MATLISTGSGNFTSSSTWSVVDPTSFSGTFSAPQAITTAPINGSSFTPGAITIKGFAVFLNTRGAAGTVTCQLFNVTANSAVAGTSATINLTALPTTLVAGGNPNLFGIGWVYFEFASPITLLAATLYAVRLNASSNGIISAWRTTTTADWLRALVTTSNAAPANTDNLIIAGKHTLSTFSNGYNVIMDSTTTGATFGNLFISTGSELNYGTTASTDYYLRLSGSVNIAAGATMTIGTPSSRMPSSSTATLALQSTVLNTPVSVEGAFIAYGATMTSQAKLAADVAIGATNSTTDVSTGWLNGDTILVPSTTRTPTQAETKTLSTNASGTTLTHNAYTNAHGGNSATQVQARIGNLNRNVKILGTVTFPAYIVVRNLNTYLDLSYTEIRDIGYNAATNAAITISPVASVSPGISVVVDNCSIWRTATTNSGIGISFNADPGNSSAAPVRCNITNNIVYNYVTACLNFQITTSAFTNNPTINGNLFCRSGSNGLNINRAVNFNNNYVTSHTANGIVYVSSSVSNPAIEQTTFDGNSIYANGGNGLSFSITSQAITNWTFSNLSTWRNTTYGVAFAGSYAAGGVVTAGDTNSITVDGFNSFGNGTAGIIFTAITGNVRLTNSYIWGGSTLIQPYGIYQVNASLGVNRIDLVRCGLGRDPLNNTSSNSTAQIAISTVTRLDALTLTNCNFTGTEFIALSGVGGIVEGPLGIISLKHNGATGAHKVFTQTSTISTDSAIFNVATPSIRIAPRTAAYKSTTHLQRIPVSSGNSCTVSVRVRKSTAGDGALYNGNQPRLIYRFNPLAGNDIDTVGATMTAAVGNWETLTYTTPAVLEDCVLEFFVDADGTVGWINVDDWSSTTNTDSRSGGYWTIGGQYSEIGYTSGGSGGSSPVTTAYTFID